MKVKDCRNKYQYDSGKAGDISRNLGLAGLALIWAFKVTTAKGVSIPPDLRWAGVLLVVSLALDFFQYVAGTIVWGVYQRIKEKQVASENEEFGAPGWINLPENVFLYLKLTATGIAYVMIVVAMFGSFWT